MAKHTPAPWWHCENETNYAIGHGNEEIAWVGQTMRVSTIETHKISKANARLIASAPELLEVAKRLLMLRAPNGDGTWAKSAPNDSDFEQAQKAIAKAEGRE